ncbi:hypothetical protein HY498_02865 [Candidatus Woesearchaeota archaeon]|nr:hypothetical protein [Candidatus Woesearchaeota archaeon]
MKKGLITVILVISLVLIISCQPTAPGGPSGFYKFTGNSAVEARFVRDAPVSSEQEYYEPGELIDVEVELANRGTRRMQPNTVRLRLTGDAIIPNFFVGAKEVLFPLSLDPIDEETGNLDTRILSLGPLRYVGDVTTRRSKIVTGQYCYYNPIVVQTRIVLSDRYEDVPAQGVQDGQYGFGGGSQILNQNIQPGDNPPSGVQVTSLNQEVVKIREGERFGTMKFKFSIENVGNGIIVDDLNNCWEYEKRRREKVSFIVKGPYPIVCEEGTVVLREGKRTVDCTMTGVDASNLGPFPRDLIIILDGFAYLEEIPPVTIWLDKAYR